MCVIQVIQLGLKPTTLLKKQLQDSIDTFIERFVMVPKDQHSTCWLNWLSTKLQQQRALEQQQRDSHKARNSEKKSQDQSISLDIREPERMHIHLLDRLRTRLLANHGGQMVHSIDLETQKDLNWQSYHNIQELQATGIYLKRSKYSSLILRDIFLVHCFVSDFFGFLQLQQMTQLGPSSSI